MGKERRLVKFHSEHQQVKTNSQYPMKWSQREEWTSHFKEGDYLRLFLGTALKSRQSECWPSCIIHCIIAVFYKNYDL